LLFFVNSPLFNFFLTLCAINNTLKIDKFVKMQFLIWDKVSMILEHFYIIN
jgi:hypothetical protein